MRTPARRQPDLLLGLAQARSRAGPRRPSSWPAAREGDLAGVRAQVVAPAGEDGVQRRPRRRGTAGRARRRPCGRGRRAPPPPRASAAAARARRRGTAQAISTRSSKATSPSSVRCTGHLAAMICRRSTCSGVRWSGMPHHELELGRAAALGRRVVAVDLEAVEVPALALGVHLHRDRRARGERGREQLLRARAHGPRRRSFSGSSARKRWSRTLRSWVYFFEARRADGSHGGHPIEAHASSSGLKSIPVSSFGEEVGGLGRHRLAGGGDLAHLGDRARAQEEREVVRPWTRTSVERLGVRARVAEPVEVGDVVVGEPERALEDQRLEHRGVEAAVGLAAGRPGRRRRSPGPCRVRRKACWKNESM